MMRTDQLSTLCTEYELPSASARLHCLSCRPDVNAWARLAIIHGYGDHAGRYWHFMRWMAGQGVACGAADLRGHGRSDGKRGFVEQWDHYLDDVHAFLSSGEMTRESDGPLFVLGHSHGGLIAAAAAQRARLEPFRGAGIILCSPFLVSRLPRQRWNATLARVLNFVAPAMGVANGLKDEWMTHDAAMIEETRHDPLYVRTATARWYLGQIKARRDVLSQASELRLPLLAIAGSDDPIADPAGTERFVAQAASIDKQFRLHPGKLHELLRESDRQQTFADIIDWMRRLTREPASL